MSKINLQRFRRASKVAIPVAALLVNSTISYGSDSFLFSYGGRFASAYGDSVKGPVDVEIKFFRDASGGTPIPISPIVKKAVALTDGLFQFDLTEMTAAEANMVFSSTLAVWLEVTDTTNHMTYPRQKLTAVPYAFKVPVDNSTIAYDSDGHLKVGTLSIDKISGLEAALALKSDSSKPVSASGIQGKEVNPVAPASGQVLVYDGTRWSPQSVAPSGGSVTKVNAVPPLGVTSGSSTPTLTLSQANSVASGYLSASDWLNFSGKINKSGDTLTGNLNFAGVGTVTGLSAPSNTADAATKGYVDNNMLRKDGSMPLTGPLSLANLTSTQEGLLSLSAADKGKTWYNNTTNEIKFYDGTAAKVLRASLSGTTPLSTAQGGTGVNNSSASAGNILIHDGTNGFAAGSLIAGTGINLAPSGTNIMINTLQDISPTASPNFANLKLAGNVGIGMSNAAANTNGNPLFISAGAPGPGYADKLGGTLILKSGSSTGTGGSDIQFHTATGGSSGTSANPPTQKMTIKDSGNVGIGTTNPSSTLSVNGSIAVGVTVFLTSNGFSYNVSPNEAIIIFTGTDGGTVNLPSCAAADSGRLLTFTSRVSSQTISFSFTGGSMTNFNTSLGNNGVVRIVCDGQNNWQGI